MSVQLPTWNNEETNDYAPPSPRQALRVAINLKKLIDTVVPFANDSDPIDSPDVSNIDIVSAVYRAAGGEGSGRKSSARKYQACLVFCLLKVSEWFEELAEDELADNDLYMKRALAAQKLAGIIISREREDKYLFLSILCHRYSINLNDLDSNPANVLELAIDMNVSCVINTPGFQRCIKWLWRGWIIQSKFDQSEYVLFKGANAPGFWNHFHPDRIQTPLYQNFLEIAFALLYLALFTLLVNIDVDEHSMGVVELSFLLFTIGFSLDEFVKFYHIGTSFFRFQNAFNCLIYTLIYVSYIFRIMGIFSNDADHSTLLQIRSYRFLSCTAPLIWIRMFFFCDIFKLVGVYMVIIKKMMKESIMFFFMLSVVIIGFLQAFIGLDQADGHRDLTYLIVTNMLKAVLSGPDFKSLERFAYPYASILYYCYNFLVSVILLNILIALFAQAYSDVVELTNEYYLLQYSSRVLNYIRAPDAKIYFPPLNLIEICFIDFLFKWWMDKKAFDRLNDNVMRVLYFFPLLMIANFESKTALRVAFNRQHHLADDANEEDRGWDLTDGYELGQDCEEHRANISRSVKLQNEAEEQDPKFRVNFTNWNKQLDNLAPPIKEAQSLGINLEDYQVISRLDALTKAVESLANQNEKILKEIAKN